MIFNRPLLAVKKTGQGWRINVRDDIIAKTNYPHLRKILFSILFNDLGGTAEEARKEFKLHEMAGGK